MSLLQQQPRPRIKLSEIMSHPVTDLLVMVMILVSVVLLILETALSLPQDSQIVFAGDIITGFFAVELLLRFFATKKKSRFFRRYWTDILAVLPLLRPLRFFRFFRLLRLFRLFQLGLLLDRRFAALRGVLRVNFYFLWVLLVLTGILVVGGAVMAYLLEQPTGGDFQSLSRSMWWTAYSLIAGEPIGTMPQTIPGRALLAGLMLGGSALFAVFTGLVSATMIDRLQGLSRIVEMDIDELERHIVICGWNAGVIPLLAELAVDKELRGLPIVLVNERESIPDLSSTGLRAELIYHLRGDFTQLDVLENAGIRRAGRAVVMADDTGGHQRGDRDPRSVLAALTIERMCPGIYCVVELMDGSNQAHLAVAGVEAVIMRNDLSGRALASACKHPQLMGVMMDLLTSREGAGMERLPGPKEPMSFGELFTRLKMEEDLLLIGVEQAGQVRMNPPPGLKLGPEDHVIVICRG